MGAPRYLRLGLLVLCLNIAISAYAGAYVNGQLMAAGGEEAGLVSNGIAHTVSHTSSITLPINSNSSLSAGQLSASQPDLPGSKYGGKGFSDEGDLKPINPPLPPDPVPEAVPIPEPNVLLDLGIGLATFATIWSFRIRRSA